MREKKKDEKKSNSIRDVITFVGVATFTARYPEWNFKRGGEENKNGFENPVGKSLVDATTTKKA